MPSPICSCRPCVTSAARATGFAPLPDGVVDPMLWVNAYRADWPSPYILKDAIALPAGTRLVMTAYYDNKTDAAIAAKPSLSITAVPPSRPSATLEP